MKVDYWGSTKKIQLKENSTDNSAEKNLKENSKFNELWNFSIKKKKKKNTQIQRTLFPRTLSQISFPQIVLKICNTLSFLSLSFSFLLYKIPL